MKSVYVSGSFDDMKFEDFRFLEEASKLGNGLRVWLMSDDQIRSATGKAPKFPQAEREYLLGSIRWVESIVNSDAGLHGDVLAVRKSQDDAANRQIARSRGMEYRLIRDELLQIVPPAPAVPVNPRSSRKKVVVTGCYDWFHSGHVRFFEECSELGELYVVVGHDANIRLLKGEGHPLFPALQRRYLAGAIRFVKLALISSGDGWMDAEPEFEKLKPDIYVVNEDGDKPEKLAFCQKHGIEYKVLKRLPKQGLPRRQSTVLRGF
jgi:cytidyltransferase-like protein